MPPASRSEEMGSLASGHRPEASSKSCTCAAPAAMTAGGRLAPGELWLGRQRRRKRHRSREVLTHKRVYGRDRHPRQSADLHDRELSRADEVVHERSPAAEHVRYL